MDTLNTLLSTGQKQDNSSHNTQTSSFNMQEQSPINILQKLTEPKSTIIQTPQLIMTPKQIYQHRCPLDTIWQIKDYKELGYKYEYELFQKYVDSCYFYFWKICGQDVLAKKLGFIFATWIYAFHELQNKKIKTHYNKPLMISYSYDSPMVSSITSLFQQTGCPYLYPVIRPQTAEEVKAHYRKEVLLINVCDLSQDEQHRLYSYINGCCNLWFTEKAPVIFLGNHLHKLGRNDVLEVSI